MASFASVDTSASASAVAFLSSAPMFIACNSALNPAAAAPAETAFLLALFYWYNYFCLGHFCMVELVLLLIWMRCVPTVAVEVAVRVHNQWNQLHRRHQKRLNIKKGKA